MLWPLLATAGMQLLQGISQRNQAKEQAKLEQTNADATNIVRAGNDQLAAAVGSLNRWRQSVGNQRTIEQYADNSATLQTNLQRTYQNLNSTSLEQRLVAAQEAGAATAAMNAAGLGGNTRDMINSTLQIAAQRKQDLLSDQKRATGYDVAQQLAGMTDNLAYQLDDSTIIDQVDTRQEHAQAYIPSIGRTLLSSALGTLSSPLGQSAFSLLGGSSSAAQTAVSGTGSKFNYNTGGRPLFKI